MSRDGLRRGEGWIKERRRADGTVAYQACWLDDGEIARAKTFASRDAAEDHLRDVRRKKRDGRYEPPSSLTVRGLLSAWLERGAGRWKANTVYGYRMRAEHQIYPELGSLLAASLTTARVQRWIDDLARSGLSPATIRLSVTVLKAAFRDAVALGLVPANPVPGAKSPSLRRQPAATWSAADVARVFAAVADRPMWSALYRLALATGMRPGELRALRWGDVRESEGLVRVRRTMTRQADGRAEMGGSTKTGRERAVALPASVVAALSSWRTAQKARRIARANVWRDQDLIFDDGRGGVLPASTWTREHQAIIERAGVPPITLHGLRHSAATLLLERNTHPKVVSEMLGHQSITTTLDIYAHVSVSLQRAAADALDAELRQASATTTTLKRGF